MTYEHIGICYHGLNPEAGDLARAIAGRIGSGHTVTAANQDELDVNPEALSASDLVITIGGDGTILRGVHVAAPRGVPVLGVNMGRVGFMSDIDSGNALDSIDWYLNGNARVEEREMVRAEVVGSGQPPLDALNDIAIARGQLLRVIDVSTMVDGVHFATFRGDGVVVATATGSTGYALSLGGPGHGSDVPRLSRKADRDPHEPVRRSRNQVDLHARTYRRGEDAGDVKCRWLHGR